MRVYHQNIQEHNICYCSAGNYDCRTATAKQNEGKRDLLSMVSISEFTISSAAGSHLTDRPAAE
jgi:hypothetical protein